MGNLKILVTGGAGFLGSAIVNVLTREYCDIAIPIRESTDIYRLSQLKDKITFYKLNEISIEGIIEHFKPDVVIHTAVVYGHKEDVFEVFENNVYFYLKLFKACVSNNVRHFINTDTFSSKDLGYEYLKSYHLSKKNCLEWTMLILENSSMKFSNMRLEHLYGPMDNKNKFTFFILESLLNHVEELNLTSGSQKRDFIYTYDAAEAFLAVINKQESSFEEFEVGTGTSTSIRAFVELAKKTLSNNSTKLNFGALPTRMGEIEDSKADISKLSRLGWYPNIDLEKGLNFILKDLNNNNV